VLRNYVEQLSVFKVFTGNNSEIHKDVKRHSSNKVIWPTAQLKCLYTNACSICNKQEKLDATVLLESYNLVAITENWWDRSHE